MEGGMRGHTDSQMGLLGRGSKLRTLKQNVKETETRKKPQLIVSLPPVMHSVKKTNKQNSSKVKKKMAKRRHQGGWNTITTWRLLLCDPTHPKAEPLGVATP